MKILSLKPGHDGSVAFVDNGVLEFSYEAEKDSFPRYTTLNPTTMLDAFSKLEEHPDVFCVSGWVKGFHSVSHTLEAGYYGHSTSGVKVREMQILGKEVSHFSSTHERSHLLCSYAMSPFHQGQPCYALVWEGNIGKFYFIDEHVNIKEVRRVLSDPGNRYSFLFSIGNPSSLNQKGHFDFSNSGKLMALAAYGQPTQLNAEEEKLLRFLMTKDDIILSTQKSDLRWSPFLNIGVEAQEFKNVAKKLSNAIFERFEDAAKQVVDRKIPLLISGGCGLNCGWNSRWVETDLFEEVFVPPCPNDTGSAIGTAVDAQLHFTGDAKLKWSVYSGQSFDEDVQEISGCSRVKLDLSAVADRLQNGEVVAWAQGRCEIGPRALGNRSILASPFHSSMRERLNKIKIRERYRPIAPVCLLEDVDEHFVCHGPSPHMLYFQIVKNKQLEAITHVDGTSRVQTVCVNHNKMLHELLVAFRNVSGAGVLCNTSLNRKGFGFINKTSDLARFCSDRGIRSFVVNGHLYTFDEG